MINKSFVIICLSFVLIFPVHAQIDTLKINYEMVIDLALRNSPKLRLMASQLRENQLGMEGFHQSLRPEMKLNAILPNLSRSIEARPLPDGRDAFVNRSTMYNNVGFELTDQIPGLNASWYFRTRMERLDVFETEQFPSSQTYFFTPISVGVNLNLFNFNELKWEQEKIKLQNRELTTQHADLQEEISVQVLTHFSNCFQIQKQIEIIQQQINDTDTLYQIKKRLNEFGTVSKTELLQLELQKQNYQDSYDQRIVEFNKATRTLFDYIKLEVNGLAIQFEYPDGWEPISIDSNLVLDKAIQNPYLTAKHSFLRQSLEADLEKTKKDNGIRLSLDASLGLNKTDDSLGDIFNNLLDREIISAFIEIPISNGASRRIKEQILAEEIQRQGIVNSEEIVEIKRNVIFAVEEYRFLIQRIESSRKAMEIADEIYELSRAQFLAGSIGYNNLNLAIRDRDQASTNFFHSVFEAMVRYYEIRKMCLYDFERGVDLSIQN